MFSFTLKTTAGFARHGVMQTAHGCVETPAFMPVGTQGTVKSLHPMEVAASGSRLIICNTYHLWLRPGPELIAEKGGLHAFMHWPHAIATDSGGFQAFSLSQRVRVSERGFEFASHLDGARKLLTPEESMRVQGLLGSDIALQLDICPPAGAPREHVREAVARTTRWAERCLEAKAPTQALFGIVQGATDVQLRLEHAAQLASLPIDGIALGGFSVGEPSEAMHETLRQVVPHVDANRPRYLMGVGTPSDLVRAIGVGVDLFDCVMPTRNARNGQVFVSGGRLNIRNAQFRNDPLPLDETCRCPVCSHGFSRAYLRHLFVAEELLALRLLTEHNLWFYASLVAEARREIARGAYLAWAAEKLRLWAKGNLGVSSGAGGTPDSPRTASPRPEHSDGA